MGLDVMLLSGHELTEASSALRTTPGKDRQIILRASELLPNGSDPVPDGPQGIIAVTEIFAALIVAHRCDVT